MRTISSKKKAITSCAGPEEKMKNGLNDNGCNSSIDVKIPPDFINKLARILQRQGVNLHPDELDFFAGKLIRSREQHRKKMKELRNPDSPSYAGILLPVQKGQSEKHLDEAIWRVFLVSHFGYDRIQSAKEFFYAFGPKPFWTWEKVRNNPDGLWEWLYTSSGPLKALKFGNHRKYESKKPAILQAVIQSFLNLTGDSPAKAFYVESHTPQERFRLLYKRLNYLKRFGRTGKFDFLCLLRDMQLIDLEPDSCYIAGATGPQQGAIKLWGKRDIKELDALASELANEMNLSHEMVEDALCNWQK